MPYDEKLADRVRKLIGDDPGYVEKRMFRGLAMMLDGNMAVCVNPTGLLVRIDPATQEQVLTEPGTRLFVMGQRADEGLGRGRHGGPRHGGRPAPVGQARRRLRPGPAQQVMAPGRGTMPVWTAG